MNNKTIKITNGRGWYINEVDNKFQINLDSTIELNNHLAYQVIQNGEISNLCIRQGDFKVIE